MKSIFLILFHFFLIQSLAAQDVKWKMGAALSNGVSVLERQELGNALNNKKTSPTSLGYFNQLEIYRNKPHKSGKGFGTLALSHRIFSYRGNVYDSRLEITNGGLPELRKTNVRYQSLNFSYIYNRYLKETNHAHWYAGLGFDLNFNYRKVEKLHLADGKQTIVTKGSQISNNFYINTLPTLIVKLGAEIDALGIEDMQVGFVYKKDLHYLISSGVPAFGAYGIYIGVPFLNKK